MNKNKREYYLVHRDEILKRRKEHSLVHKDKIREYQEKYRLAHKDKTQEYQKKYRQAHRNKMMKYNREYYQRNKEHHLVLDQQWKEKNKEKMLQYNHQYQKNRRERIRKASLDLLGEKCCQCGITDSRVLQIDHIFNDGKVDRKDTRDTQVRLEKIIKYPEKYQLLCANCHAIKTYEFGWGKTNEGIINKLDEPIQLNFWGEA